MSFDKRRMAPSALRRQWFGHPLRTALLLTALAVLLVLTSPIAHAQANDTAARQHDTRDVDPELVESRLEALRTSPGDDATAALVAATYRNVLNNLAAARTHRAAAARLQRLRANAPQRTREVRRALEEADASDPVPALPDAADPTPDELDRRLRQAQADEAAAALNLADLEQRLVDASLRPGAVRQRLSAAAQEAAAITERLADSSPAGQPSTLVEAQHWAQLTALEALDAEIETLQQELLSQPDRVELLEAERDRAATDLAAERNLVSALQDRLSQRRRRDTEQTLAAVDLEALGDGRDQPQIQTLIGDIRELATTLSELGATLERVNQDKETTASRLEELRQRFRSTRQKLEDAGVNRVLGRYLGEERRQLSELRQARHAPRQREDEIAAASLRNIRLDQQWRSARDVDRYVDAMLRLAGPVDRPPRAQLTALAEQRRDLLRKTMALNDDYLRGLAEVEYLESQIHTLRDDYREYLAEHLLWVRSSGATGIADLLTLPEDLAQFLAPARWLESATVFAYQATHSVSQILVILLLLVAAWQRRALHERLRATGTRARRRPSSDRFAYTLKALGLTLLLALPWPVFIAVTGWQLVESPRATEASAAVGTGLLQISPLLFFLRSFRLLCSPGGVAEGHFHWSAPGLARLKRQMDVLLVTLLAPAFVTVANREFQDADLGGALSRLSFLVLVGGLTLFLYRLFAPGSGIAGALTPRGRTQPTLQAWVYVVAATSIPLGLALMAMAGYMYSADTLLMKLINTLWLLFGLVLLHELIVRWLLVTRRRLRLRQALAHREAARSRPPPETTQEDDVPAPADASTLDIATLDSDTRKLVNVVLAVAGLLGVFGIWSNVLPAGRLLNDVTLWTYLAGSNGQGASRAVTLGDLLRAAVAVLLTVVAVRNLPSLIEIILRQRQTVTAGSRLAFTTLTRYAIAITGIGIVLGTIGVNWSKLQWLVAALGVGIGFGLQEIVANFISGLIILMERPIRVGDVVTVGDTSGTVTQVRIRATTITNWDRQELLVPNKEFITGRVLNWSLSDDVIRIYFTIGIAYGSDVESALRLTQEVANEHPNVLQDPAPLVTFEGFGDNALTLGLRCFVPSLKVRLETITDLHRAINTRFADAGIVIAFPQRDIHLDARHPLEVKLIRGSRPDSGPVGPGTD